MKFADKSFKHVVFDPPHLLAGGVNGWQRKKYGILAKATWKEDLTKGFDFIKQKAKNVCYNFIYSRLVVLGSKLAIIILITVTIKGSTPKCGQTK